VTPPRVPPYTVGTVTLTITVPAVRFRDGRTELQHPTTGEWVPAPDPDAATFTPAAGR